MTIESLTKSLHDTDIATMPLANRVNKVIEMQKGYWEPLLRRDFPDLFTEERPDSVRLALTLMDFELKERETKRQNPGSEKLRDTVIDAFVRDFFATPGGIRKLSLAASDVTANTSWKMGDTQNLLEQASQRLQTLKSRDHLGFFAYKNRPENLTSFNAGAALKQNIEYAFAEPDANSGWEKAAGQTARALLEFYWNNSRNVTTTQETTPVLALVHDLFFAGSIAFDPPLSVKLGNWITDKLQKPKDKAKFLGELDECYKAAQREVQKLSGELRKDYAPHGEKVTFDDFLGSLDEEFMKQWIERLDGRYIIGKNYDRLIGMESTFGFLSKHGIANLYEQAARKWRQELERKAGGGRTVSRTALSNLQKREEDERQAIVWRKVLNAYDPDHYLLDGIASCLMDKGQYLERTAALGGLNRRLLADPILLQKRITRGEFDDIPKGTRDMLLANALLINMFTETAPNDINGTLSLKEGNDRIRKKITTENEWFVATNGDQFPAGLNPDLAQNHLSSLTVYPDKKRHGGYRIQMNTDFLDRARKPIGITLYFNGDGQLYYDNRRQMILPVWLAETVKNLLLTRIDFVTGGALSGREKAEESPKAIEAGKPADELASSGVTYKRRPCYRILTSTPDRKFTLQTAKAQSHAAQVLKDFGVDIYRTNLERRLAGTLAENQAVTIDMGVIDPDAAPNQIRYTP